MRLVLLTEGPTEKALAEFLKRWLDPRLENKIGIRPVSLGGIGNYLKKAALKVKLHLEEADTIAVFGLVDLYGLKLDFPRNASRDKKVAFARQELNRTIGANHLRFKQHFAVHETEAWLLSDRELFPGTTLPPKCDRPEDVNFDEPPAQLLARLTGDDKKTTRARNLFPRLDPALVYEKCPNFRAMMDEMLAFAGQALAASDAKRAD